MLSKTFSEYFPVKTNLIYLAHGRIGPICKPALTEISRFISRMSYEGAKFHADLPEEIMRQKQVLSLFLGCSPNEIAYFTNASECLARVLLSIDWAPGDNIVASTNEFPGILHLIDSLRIRGVVVRLVETSEFLDDETAFLSAISKKTKLVVASHVNYLTGKRLNVEWLCKECHAYNVLTAIDFVQSLGALKIDLSLIQCDFGIFVGRKWMLSCDGLGVLTVRKDLLDTLDYPLKGIRSYAEPLQYGQKILRSDAVKLELGYQPILAATAFAASARFFLELGLDKIEADVVELAKSVRSHAQECGLTVVGPECDDSKISGLVALDLGGEAEVSLVHTALRKKDIEVGSSGHHLLIGAHFYNSSSEVEVVFDALKILKNGLM